MKCVVFGSTGYAGIELVNLLCRHQYFELEAVLGSHQEGIRSWASLVPSHAHLPVDNVLPSNLEMIAELDFEVAFLALPHEASVYWAEHLARLDVTVFDLSGAFRLRDSESIRLVYGIEVLPQSLSFNAPYMLMPWVNSKVDSKVYAIPGCYPTAALLGLKPLMENNLLDTQKAVAITGISGVSGAGRAPSSKNSFCEVSIQPYGVLEHRHEPEITQHLGARVHFTPVIAAIPRGLVVVCEFQLTSQQTSDELLEIYVNQYHDCPLIHIKEQAPAAHHVAHTPFCHISIQSRGESGVVVAAIDNLLMGAASQALEAANVVAGFSRNEGIYP